jgi:leader peptidase (prepilin peptidase) / N-methyltransferase
VTLPWVIAGTVVGLLAGPRIRAVVFAGSTSAGQPPRRECPDCSSQVLPGRWRWRSVLPVTGRCPACQVRIGPPLLAAELAAGGALAIVAARASSGWELAALAWLALIAVPLALTDMAVHRLPDKLTATAFTGTLALLAVAALTAHQPDRLARAAIGAAALACFYLALCLIRPGQMGLGDAKLAAGIGLALGWTDWQALFTGTFAAFILAAAYGGVLLTMHRASRTSQLPLGPFILLGALAAIVLLYVGSYVVCRNLTADVVRMSYTTFTAVPKARVDDGVLRESLATTRVSCLSGCHPQGRRRFQQRYGSVAVSGPSRCQRLRQGLSSLMRLIA